MLLVSERVKPCLVMFGWPRILSHANWKEHEEIRGNTLQGTNISHLGKRKIIFKSAFKSGYDMLVPRRVRRRSGPTNHAWIVNHTCNSSVYPCITCTCFEIGYIFQYVCIYSLNRYNMDTSNGWMYLIYHTCILHIHICVYIYIFTYTYLHIYPQCQSLQQKSHKNTAFVRSKTPQRASHREAKRSDL